MKFGNQQKGPGVQKAVIILNLPFLISSFILTPSQASCQTNCCFLSLIFTAFLCGVGRGALDSLMFQPHGQLSFILGFPSSSTCLMWAVSQRKPAGLCEILKAHPDSLTNRHFILNFLGTLLGVLCPFLEGKLYSYLLLFPFPLLWESVARTLQFVPLNQAVHRGRRHFASWSGPLQLLT